MRNYRKLSKLVLVISGCGIAAAIFNEFTGIINSSVQGSGTAVCIAGFAMAGTVMAILEKARTK